MKPHKICLCQGAKSNGLQPAYAISLVFQITKYDHHVCLEKNNWKKFINFNKIALEQKHDFKIMLILVPQRYYWNSITVEKRDSLKI
jgi:hypothetical protein